MRLKDLQGSVQYIVGLLESPGSLLFLTILLIVLGAWIFFVITEEVLEAETQELDERILLALRAPSDVADPVGPRWLEQAAVEITSLGGTSLLSLFTLVVAVFLWLNRKRGMLVLVLISILGGVFVSFGLKALVGRPRPSAVPSSPTCTGC